MTKLDALRKENALLKSQLSTAVTKQILLLEKLIELEKRVCEAPSCDHRVPYQKNFP